MKIKPKKIPAGTLIDVGGCRLNFSGIPGSETRLLLEVGGGADSTFSGFFPMDLAQVTGATLVTYDRAGFGKSALPDTIYDMVEEIDWFMAGMRQLDLKEVIQLIS